MCQLSSGEVNALHNSISCPFTIRQLNSTTYLIREGDGFGEYPHIYVKRCTQTSPDGSTTSVLIITDTGVGTTSSNPSTSVLEWSLKTFIDHHLNPDGEIPYLVLLSHCHFDHILGLPSLLSSSHCKVLSSSYDPTFTTPYSVLSEHSLCTSLSLPCPVYQTTMVSDDHVVDYTHPHGNEMKLPARVLHTPGHTPDSLSWYDGDERILYVGDSFYSQQSEDTKAAPWGPERSAPIIFPKEGNLFDWWASVDKLLIFVGEKNGDAEEGSGTEQGRVNRVKLSAGHVTAGVDAQSFLENVKGFMGRLLRNEVPFIAMPDRREETFGHWTDGPDGEFSIAAPVRIMEEGRKRIPEGEWMKGSDSG